ncbi:30S ribosomal protein S21 [Rhizobium sp. P38BS-XIX]|nr:30S ribosomal protein S21 [Rhizobium sp. P38BS-XIX]
MVVRDNNIDQALRVLKKRMIREGVFHEIKMRSAYMNTSEEHAMKKAPAIR